MMVGLWRQIQRLGAFWGCLEVSLGAFAPLQELLDHRQVPRTWTRSRLQVFTAQS